MMEITEDEIASLFYLLNGEFKKGSDDEKKARHLLARVQRNLLSLTLKRPRGRTKSVNDNNVAEVIWHRIQIRGDKKEAAYQYAVETEGVGLTTAKKAYKKWEPHFRARESKLKGLDPSCSGQSASRWLRE